MIKNSNFSAVDHSATKKVINKAEGLGRVGIVEADYAHSQLQSTRAPDCFVRSISLGKAERIIPPGATVKRIARFTLGQRSLVQFPTPVRSCLSGQRQHSRKL